VPVTGGAQAVAFVGNVVDDCDVGEGETGRVLDPRRAGGRWFRCVVARGLAGGASPAATERGSEERPIRWVASWLADHASATLAASPNIASAAHKVARRVTAGRYSPAG
jgi:hypothetical protein